MSALLLAAQALALLVGAATGAVAAGAPASLAPRERPFAVAGGAFALLIAMLLVLAAAGWTA